jgi:hypothetical protein
MTSFVIPRMFTNRKGMTQKKFFSDFSTLIADTVFQSIITKKVHQVFFDFNHHKIIIKQHNLNIDEKKKEAQFEAVPKNIFNNQIHLPESFRIRNFFIEKNDEIKPGAKTNDAWFYIMSDGTSQPVIINIDDDSDDQETKFSISINPFYSQATLHDTFQKP